MSMTLALRPRRPGGRRFVRRASPPGFRARFAIPPLISSGQRTLLAAAYSVALLLALSSLLDLGTRLWPLQFGSEDWRFGAMGILFNSLVTPLLGLGLAMAAAYIGRHRGILAACSGIALVAAAVMTLALVAFIIASLSVNAKADVQLKSTVSVATWKTVILALAIIPAAALLGVGGMRALRGTADSRFDPQSGLVVGQP